MMKMVLLSLLLALTPHVWAQSDIESEVEDAEGPAIESEEPSVQLKPADSAQAPQNLESEESETSAIEKEIQAAESNAPIAPEKQKTQQAIQKPVVKETPKAVVQEPIKSKTPSKIKEPEVIWPREQETVSADPNLNRFPDRQPYFKKPEGPKEGGVVRVPHPDAAKGLTRINRDGTYQYKTKLKAKSQAASMRAMSMSPPKISVSGSTVTYNSMYGSAQLTGLLANYEWQPFTSFGRMGLQLESGFATIKAQGSFKNAKQLADGTPVTEARETYTLYIVPLTAFLNYRFEYVRRQWIVPFINGGATYFGMYETRDDNKQNTFAGAAAVGGGGGVHFSLSRLDPAGSFTMAEEYGIADMWLTLEARAMQGLNKETDFTSQSIHLGVTVDF